MEYQNINLSGDHVLYDLPEIPGPDDIKNARLMLGLNQTDFAQAIGYINQTSIVKLEKEESSPDHRTVGSASLRLIRLYLAGLNYVEFINKKEVLYNLPSKLKLSDFKNAREALGLTKQELAPLLSIKHVTTINRFERGKNDLPERQPSKAVILLLRAYLSGVRPDDWP